MIQHIMHSPVFLFICLCLFIPYTAEAQYDVRYVNTDEIVNTPPPSLHRQLYHPYAYTSILNENQIDPNYSFKDSFRNSPSLAFAGSFLLPGLSQAMNDSWFRSSFYFLVEAAALTVHFSYLNKGRNNESAYQNYVNSNWSVTKYAEFLVNYNNFYKPGNTIDLNDLATDGNTIPQGQYAYGKEGWVLVDINKLRDLERVTLYSGSSGTAFSHVLPNYDSQQYYELVSKYYQFGPGWSDFSADPDAIIWNKEGMSQQWHDGVKKAERFNDQLRVAGYMVSVLVVNHFISAFDAYFEVKLKTYRNLNEPKPNINGTVISYTYRF